jgi:hypothetical protein
VRLGDCSPHLSHRAWPLPLSLGNFPGLLLLLLFLHGKCDRSQEGKAPPTPNTCVCIPTHAHTNRHIHTVYTHTPRIHTPCTHTQAHAHTPCTGVHTQHTHKAKYTLCTLACHTPCTRTHTHMHTGARSHATHRCAHFVAMTVTAFSSALCKRGRI